MGKRGPEKQPLDKRHNMAMFLQIYALYDKKQVCEHLDISRMTLWKWEKREDYQKEYDKMQRKRRREASRMIKKAWLGTAR